MKIVIVKCQNGLLQNKLFLGIVTIFAAIMLTFPFYAKNLLLPNTNNPNSKENISHLQTVEIVVSGMTCGGCEAHVEHSISELEGVVEVKAIVSYDLSQTNVEEIEKAIHKTKYIAGQVKVLE